MLNVTVQSSAAGAKSYFARSDYYREGQELVGEWGGKAAGLLRLSGTVDKQAFDRLCDNRHPETGEQLTKINRGGRRVGYDFTWSAPKSISVVHALTGDGQIVDAFRKSIRETMTDMEGEMQARVRKSGHDFDRTTANYCYAEFIHLTSRPVDGVPCPQLHAHNFVFNATHDSHEQQWKAGQFGKIKDNAYYWQAVQQARFANELQQVGYKIRRTKDAFEIEGVPESALKKLSLRTSLIERVAERLGITSAKIKAKLGATTREAKDSSIPYDELVELWESMLSKEEIAAIGVVSQEKSPQTVCQRDAEHVAFAANHIFERSSVIDERRLLTLALRHGLGEVTPEEIQAEAARLDLLKRTDGNHVWVTTESVLAEERGMIAFAVTGKGSFSPLDAQECIEFRDKRLNAGQRNAVVHVLTSPDRVMVVEGAAGVGKTALTREAASQLESRGKSVVMLAPSAQASRGVLRDEGFSEADTLSKFLADDAMQATAQHGVIWLDESGLVGTPTMARLFETAKRLDARIVLSGDTGQMGSVERGDAMRVLKDIARLPVARVTEIQRQTNADYKQAVSLLAKGQMTEGYEKLDAMGCVKLLPVWESYRPIAEEYSAHLALATDKERDKAALIVSPTHAEGRKITDAVRTELKDRGLIGRDEQDFTRLVPLQWTEAERADAGNYTGDEILQFHRHSGVHKAGDRIRASDMSVAEREKSAKHFAAYSPDSIGLSAGDSVRVTANGKTLDGKHRLNNGAVYRVAGFTAAGDITLSNGWVVDKDFGHLMHGYVSTPHAAQGRTVQHVIVAQTTASSPAVSREGFYVAASRGRQSLTVYTDDKRELKEAIRHSEPRPSATELVSSQRSALWKRLKQAGERIRHNVMMTAKRTFHDVSWRSKEPEAVYER